MKSAKEFWKEKFDEYPQSDSDKLAIAMMTEYANQDKWVDVNELQNQFSNKEVAELFIKAINEKLNDITFYDKRKISEIKTIGSSMIVKINKDESYFIQLHRVNKATLD